MEQIIKRKTVEKYPVDLYENLCVYFLKGNHKIHAFKNLILVARKII